MSTHTDTRAGCGCGCTPGDEACTLECLVRPRFFCGQLLFDDDLAAMVQWAAGRLGLQRYRDGWGVACGLDVRRDPQRPLRVIVGPGYAVSCCGDDIVVCDETALDLSGALGGDPCATPVPVPPPTTAGPTSPAAAVAQMRRELTSTPAATTAAEQPGREVDIVVRFAEREAEPRASLRHSDCVQAPDCEPARIRETFELAWIPAEEDPGKAASDAWCQGYAKCLDVLRLFLAQAGKDWTMQRTWLKAWIDAHPPELVGDLGDRVAAWADAKALNDGLVGVLVLLVADCRWAYTHGPCHACERSTGVRLARVRLDRPKASPIVRVLTVDNHVPYRRPLTPAGAPAPLGRRNVGHLVGERWVEARRALTRLGLRPTKVTVALSGTAGDLLKALDTGCPVADADADGDVVVQVVQLGKDDATERVIGLRGGVAVAAQHSLTDAERRRIEVDRLKEVQGVGVTLAERLTDAGLTLGRIAETDERDRAGVEAEIALQLPRRFPGTAAEVVDQARGVWERTYRPGSGRA